MLTRPIATRLPSISALRLNITTLYTVDVNGTSAVATFGLRPLIPIRLAILELCAQNQMSSAFPQLMKPSGVALGSPRIQPGQAGHLANFNNFFLTSNVTVVLSLPADPLTSMWL